jgi:G:T-mismatch repair DNA endonuclease (very short patch repair protein)
MEHEPRGKDTKFEIAVSKMLHTAGFRFRLHVKDLPGKPDSGCFDLHCKAIEQ